ncbi:MAG: RNA polymerase factor sigma-54 [Algiphilus sp.]|uniref:RNA polymerase factor sigma-54 n=1 Tax=Algiphilus sp. TaxID=1872431 RepID=UPI0032EB2BEC
MRVDFSQQQGGRQTLNPQLAQQIRILGLSAQELEQEVHQWLENNVMLEPEGVEHDDEASDAETQAEDAQDEITLDSNWDDGYAPMAGCAGGEDAEVPIAAPEVSDPVARLARELPMECRSPRALAAAFAVLEALDERGWLEEDLHDIACRTGFPTGELVSALALIQKLAPAGFGARDLAECFALQLRAMTPSDAVRDALAIVGAGLERLAGREIGIVQRELRLDDAAFAAALALLRRLDPHPGRASAEGAAVYPDVVVAQLDGRWTVTLSEFATPRLRVNPHYLRALEASAAPAPAMKQQLYEARWFLRGLAQRADTLLKVTHAIFRRQYAFLAGGEEALAPMTLREIAGEVGVHESTVSRVTCGKYVVTPRGIFELKHFFGAGFGVGCAVSNTAARALVRRFVAGEDPRAPLDDAAIATRLAERGIRVARRTVAKYREALGIPPARLRAASQSLAISA